MQKNLDHKGRWRSRAVSFRLSEEEAELLNRLVAISGLSKQEYILHRLMCRDVVVQGNPRVYKALRTEMRTIYDELSRIKGTSEISEDMMTLLKVIAGIEDINNGEAHLTPGYTVGLLPQEPRYPVSRPASL